MKKKITFSGNFLSINDSKIELDDFKQKFNQLTESEFVGDKVHIYNYQFDTQYLKISFSDGSTFPRNPNVVNTTTNAIEPNPRKRDQIEPKEYFALIDFETGFLWLNNGSKRNLLLNVLKKKFENSIVVLKNVFDQEVFIERLKNIDSMRITAVPTLFSKQNTLSAALADEIDQFEAIEAILHFRYQNLWVGNTLKEKIRSVFHDKSNFNKIMISGRDSKNNGIIFNTDIFSKKIEFKSLVDEDQMFDPAEVFFTLIGRVEDEKK